MPERSSGDQLVWFARVSLLLVTAAVVYFLTWRFLVSSGLTGWLAPLWLLETLAFVGLAFYLISRAVPHRSGDRRNAPRLPAAIPIRYATEEGQVGIGTLVDITERGAGLLIPKVALDADRIWIQFLWFDDRIGTQGRIVHAEETNQGVRLGLQLLPLHPETRNLLTNFVLPYGSLTPATRGAGTSPNGRRSSDRRQDRTATAPPLPVAVQHDAITTWAIAESLHDDGATLLMAERMPHGTRVKISHCGNGQPRECEVVHWESMRHSSIGLFRVEVRQVSPQPL
jgi:hypothetical protein